MAYSHLINCLILTFGPYVAIYKAQNLYLLTKDVYLTRYNLGKIKTSFLFAYLRLLDIWRPLQLRFIL